MVDLEENKRNLQALKKRFDDLEKTIGKTELLKNSLRDLESKTLEEGFWNDSKKSNAILQEIKEVKTKYEVLLSIKSTLNNLIELNDLLIVEGDEELEKALLKSTSSVEKDLEKFEIKMLLSGKFDKNNAIITLHPGARWNRVSRLGSNAL